MKGLRCLLAISLCAACAFAYSRDITAKSGIAIDAASGKVLWDKDAETPMFPASTTKIMTGLLLVEHCRPSDIIVAPADVEKVKEASMHLKPGERVTAHDMLYALMLRSANDGCYAVAVHISGSVEGFSKLMNDRAKQIGCTHTRFHNPNGLNDPEHMTSAHDLALIARAAMRYPEFREAVRNVQVPDRAKHQRSRPRDGESRQATAKGPVCRGNQDRVHRPGRTLLRRKLHAQRLSRDHCRNEKRSLATGRRIVDELGVSPLREKGNAHAGKVVGEVKVPGAEATPISVAVAESAYTLGPVGTKSPKATERIETLPKLQAPNQEGRPHR